MTEQEENELICEWLGWKRVTSEGSTIRWNVPLDDSGRNFRGEYTPTFRTGNDTFLMLDKLQDDGSKQLTELSVLLGRGELTPAAVRAAVLALIVETKS